MGALIVEIGRDIVLSISLSPSFENMRFREIIAVVDVEPSKSGSGRDGFRIMSLSGNHPRL
jgi:hypothetical protein